MTDPLQLVPFCERDCKERQKEWDTERYYFQPPWRQLTHRTADTSKNSAPVAKKGKVKAKAPTTETTIEKTKVANKAMAGKPPTTEAKAEKTKAPTKKKAKAESKTESKAKSQSKGK